MLLRKRNFANYAQKHLDSAKMWSEVSKEASTIEGYRFCANMSDNHMAMAKYWVAAIKTLHYVPGTWRTRF